MIVKKMTLMIFIVLIGITISINAQSPAASYKVVNLTGEVTKKINIWGHVIHPGRYEVPISTNLVDLVTYTGGPREYALMDDIKIYRVDEYGKKSILTVDLEDPSETSEAELVLYDGDTIYIDYSSILSWRDIFSIISGPLAVLASLALIIDRITARN
ncbi:MAG: hypothetical protein GXX85_00185 [Ignavibacteria bacterium]|nr:hypothetical protein [Ignavibacteria bacterium]